MRGAILGMAILATGAASLASTPRAQAGEPAAKPWSAPSSRAASGPMPRPVIPASIAPKFVLPPAPAKPPATQPVTPKIAKPDYSKRTLALIQQNIALQTAMRSAPAAPCKGSWSEAKLRRKGCLADPSRDEPAPRLSSIQVADARLCASAVEGADCGAVQAARDRAAHGDAQN